MIKVVFFFLLIPFLTACNQFKLTNAENLDLSSFSMQNCFYVRNSAGQIVSWKSVRPISFYISQNVPEKWRPVIEQASKAWTTTNGTKLIQVQSDLSTSTSPINDKKNTIYWIDSGALFKYQQGQTITRWQKNQIQDADILINSKDFSYFDENAEEKFSIHLKSLMVHEFGHSLGLRHVPTVMSVMYPELAYLQIRTDLSEIDKTSEKCEYN